MKHDIDFFTRYESKYTVTEEVVRGIREYIRAYFSPDPYIPAGRTDYLVNTVYFDTPDLHFYNDTKFCRLIRFKPRLRYYGDLPAEFVYPEIKYRSDNMIWKKRYRLPFSQLSDILIFKEAEEGEPIVKASLDSFEDLHHYCDIRPVISIRYMREAWVSDIESYARITIDHGLSCRIINEYSDLLNHDYCLSFYDDPETTISEESLYVLEIKTGTLLPFWVTDMVKTFSLHQRPFSKYCYAMDNQYYLCPSERISIFS